MAVQADVAPAGVATSRDYWTSVARLLFVTCLWSTIGLVVRSMTTASALEINAGRSGVMAVAVLLALRFMRGPRFIPPPERSWLEPSLVVALFYVTGSTFYMLAINNTSVANAVAIGATSPVFAAFLAPLFLRERTTARVAAAAVAALFGVWLMVSGADPTGRVTMLGDLAAVANAACFAGEMIALRRYRHVDLEFAFVIAGFATCALCIAANGGFSVSLHDFALIAFMGCVQLGLPVFLLPRGARDVPAVQITLISLLDVVLNPLWVWLAFAERPGNGALLGAGVIVGAVVIATVTFSPRRREVAGAR